MVGKQKQSQFKQKLSNFYFNSPSEKSEKLADPLRGDPSPFPWLMMDAGSGGTFPWLLGRPWLVGRPWAGTGPPLTLRGGVYVNMNIQDQPQINYT